MVEARIQKIADAIRVCPDFPKKGIMFRDVFSLTKNPKLLNECVLLLVERILSKHADVDAIIGLDARGFVFGSLIANHLQLPFLPARKRGKLPGGTVQTSYSLEYGEDCLEMQSDACAPGQKVIIVDDILATGGTLSAAVNLVKQLKAEVLECVVVLELRGLNGCDKIPAPVWSLIQI